MIPNACNLVLPDGRDFDLLRTAQVVPGDLATLPKNFSNYNGEVIPDQRLFDVRFSPPTRPLPNGCVAETGTFDAGIQDGRLYRPDWSYDRTPPYNDQWGRDMRVMLKHQINAGLMDASGNVGNKRRAFFNVYGAGKITDFDAAKIALWINQTEKRNVWVAAWWYAEWEFLNNTGILPLPSFNIKNGSGTTLHARLITGFDKTYKDEYLEEISWQGMDIGHAGRDYISKDIYNASLAQPYTGAFTITKVPPTVPIVSVGVQAHVDHIVYALRQYVRDLFGL